MATVEEKTSFFVSTEGTSDTLTVAELVTSAIDPNAPYLFNTGLTRRIDDIRNLLFTRAYLPEKYTGRPLPVVWVKEDVEVANRYHVDFNPNDYPLTRKIRRRLKESFPLVTFAED